MKFKKIIVVCIVFIIVLASNTLGAQAPAGSLTSAPAGSTVNFGGKTWIVLSPTDQLLLLQTPIGPMQFDPQGQGWVPSQMTDNYYNVSDAGNIAYYLNNTFLNSLSNNDRILTKTWLTTQEGSAYTLTTNAKVGLPNQTMMSMYRSYITGFTSSYYWLLDTQIDPYGWPNKRIVTNDTPYTIGQETFLSYYARPVVYLQSGAMVNGSGNIYYNNAPVISLSTNSNYLAGSSGSITLSGKVYDVDNNNVTISVTLGGVLKTTTLTPAPTTNPASNNWSLTWNGSEISQGTYSNITVNANDGALNSATQYTGTITLDKTAPTVNISGPVNLSLINNNTPQLNYTFSDGTVVVKVDGTVVPKLSGDTLTALSDGIHTVSVTATDTVGNSTTVSSTFTVDTTAPTVNILNPANNSSTNNNNPIINYGVSDGTVVVKVDGNEVSKTSGQSLDTLSEGSHTLTVQSTDAAGNVRTVNASFTVDTTAPVINISNPQDGIFSASPLFIFTVNEGVVTVKIDGVATPMISGDSLGNLTDGIHTIVIEARDSAGNISTASTTFKIDTTAPIIKILPPPGNSTNDTTPLLNFIVSDGTAVVKVDGITENKVSGDSLNELTEGRHTITVEATDQAGNKATESITFNIDSTPPVIGITSPVNGAIIVDDNPQLNYSVSEGTAIVRVDGVIVNKLPGQNLNSLVDGPHTIIIEATDPAGNKGTAASTFTIDRGAPMVFITSPTNGEVLKEKTPNITFNVSDGEVTVKVDNQVVNKNSGDFLDALNEGIHTLRVEGKDGAGNIGSAQASFKIDSVAPTVNIISPANGSTIIENTPVLSFFNSDGTAVVKIDGVVVSKIPGQKLDTLSNGSHIITVEATDTAGNKGTAESTFTVNSPTPGQTTYGPTVKITSPVNEAVTSNRNPVINYSVSEGTVTVKVDGQITNKTSGQPLDTLSEGYHTLRIESIDTKGNIGAAQVIFKVDLAGPTINITSPVTGSTIYETKPKLTFTISDGTAVVKVDGNVIAKTSGQNLDSLSLGQHTATIEATDQAGNTSVEQSTFTVSSSSAQVPTTSISDSSTQIPSYTPQTPNNFMYQNDPFSLNTDVTGIESTPMTEVEKDLYLNGSYGQDGPLKVIVSPLGGSYENPQVINLAVNKPAIIYYTTNGSNPTTESEMFSAPILADQNMTIKYFAKDGDGQTTAAQFQKYSIKNSAKSLTLKGKPTTITTQTQKIQKKAQEGEIDSSLIISALGWVMLTTAVGTFLTLKG